MAENPAAEIKRKSSIKLDLRREQWREYLLIFAFGLLLGLALNG